MGFGNKKERHPDEDGEPKKAKKAKSSDGFVPSTDKELKGYAKAGKKAGKERHESKAARKGARSLATSLRGEDLRAAMLNEEKLHVFSMNLFNKFIEIVKLKEKKPPRYKEYLGDVKGDGEFMFEIVSLLSSCTWSELASLTYTALSANEGPLGLATKSWTEAFNFARHVMLLAFKAVEKKGTLQLTDRDVLEDWPVESRKRPSKEDKMTDEELERRNAAMKAMADDEDEDEDEDEEAEEDEDEDEDEKPKKGKGKKPAKSKDEDEDDDDDEDEDDEGDDEEDETDDEDAGDKPAKKVKGKKAKSADEEDDSEDGEDEKDDPEGEKPVKKKGFAKGKTKPKKSTKEDAVKKDKKSKKDKPEKKGKDKPAKKEKEKAGKLEDSTKVFFVKKRPKKGSKTVLLGLIPKSGISLKDLIKKASDEDISKNNVKSWVPFLAKYGFVRY